MNAAVNDFQLNYVTRSLKEIINFTPGYSLPGIVFGDYATDLPESVIYMELQGIYFEVDMLADKTIVKVSIDPLDNGSRILVCCYDDIHEYKYIYSVQWDRLHQLQAMAAHQAALVMVRG